MKYLNEDDKRAAKQELIDFFERERDDKIGFVAAEEILNQVIQSIGSKIYNKGIYDAQKAIEYRQDELRYDLDELMQ